MQADIHCYLEIAREIANKQEFNKKQYLFLFEYASHLNSIQSENILHEYAESDYHSL